jgi:hypothetical protein
MTPVPSRRRSPRAIATVPLAALALALLAASALAGVKKGATYRGTTSEQRQAVSFKVSSNGRKILNFVTRLGYNGKCGQGGGPSYEVHVPSMSITSGGSFKGKVAVSLGPSQASVSVSGRIKGSKAGGVVEDPAALRCTSQPNLGANSYRETFLAKAK